MSWTAALDGLEATLAEQRAALAAGGEVHLEAYAPPPGLGPLPHQLVPRARALLADADALTDAVRAQLSSTQRELALLDRMRPQSASPSYVDRSM